MKHLRIKTKLFQRAALTMLLAVAGITNASAWWVGYGAINVNGEWFYAASDNYLDWCKGGLFGQNSLGSLYTLSIGGQVQVYADGYHWDSGSDGGEYGVTMYYKIDNNDSYAGQAPHFYKVGEAGDSNNNNILQSGGNSFSTTPIDISGLAAGEHNLEVWFISNTYETTHYKAKFRVGDPLIAKLAPDGNYWTTFYCSDVKYELAGEACAYTATLSNNTLTLNKLGSVIPQQTAVIIVASGNGTDASVNVTLSKSSNSVQNTPTNANSLRGVDVRTSKSILNLGQGTYYVLGKTNDDDFGFHPYNGDNMPSHMAFLFVSGSNSARGFSIEFGDDDATGIKTIGNEQLSVDNDNWYSLDGRKLSGKPSQRGVFINNGRKVVINK